MRLPFCPTLQINYLYLLLSLENTLPPFKFGIFPGGQILVPRQGGFFQNFKLRKINIHSDIFVEILGSQQVGLVVPIFEIDFDIF